MATDQHKALAQQQQISHVFLGLAHCITARIQFMNAITSPKVIIIIIIIIYGRTGTHSCHMTTQPAIETTNISIRHKRKRQLLLAVYVPK